MGQFLVALVVLLAACAPRAAIGQPVKLTVGYQPYDTISYSAAVIRGKGLWRNYLPEGSEVKFIPALQGSIVVKHMVEGGAQIGYLGDMPALVGISRRDVTPIKIVASTGFSPGQRCNLIMVRTDAPKFTGTAEAIEWLNGKVFATPRGSCADRFLGTLVQRGRIEPGKVLYHSLEEIISGLRSKKIDAAVLWEPTASRIGELVGEKVARIVATGKSFEYRDAGAIAMREDFIGKYPDIATAWLRAELEAQRFLLQPANSVEVARIVQSQAAGVTAKTAWFSLYGMIPEEMGGSPIRDVKPFVFDSRIRQFFEETYRYLYDSKLVASAVLPPGAIDDAMARSIAKEQNIPFPLGVINAVPLARLPKELAADAGK
jgi:NitT/TauT family transport system substrate-binding protein